VASGDVDQDSVVLWTRSTALGQVKFEISTTADFALIAGSATASVTNPNQPVKVQISGLNAGTDYFYRVIDAGGSMAKGRFETAAAPGQYAALSFGVSGDWRGELAPYPSIGNAAGKTVVLPSTTTGIDEQKGSFKVVEEAPTIEKVATALNALGVSTRDMMSIFQTMKRAGALQAELVLN
jgi:hypothetical protein